MSFTNYPEKIKEAAFKAAKEDIAHHIWFGVSLNPYSTPGSRFEWHLGFSYKKPSNMSAEPTWNFQWQRGRAAAVLMNKLSETGML